MNIVNIDLGSIKYDIVIQKGLLKNSGAEINKIYKFKKIAVITDSNVYKLYGDALKKALDKYDYNTYFIEIAPGEKSKSMEVLTYVYNYLVSIGLTRSDLIIAFGGGVVGDLAGFAASTYLRGIDYVQYPTSLLAQIDSSIGGKVAVNLEQGKNLVGSFYQPKKVLIDPDVLNTIPDKFIKDGLGEIIKYACIKDLGFFNNLANIKTKDELQSKMEQIIYTCCTIKKDMIEKDEHDKGMRMLLNFGHTLGHAIEIYSDYKYSHGESVALGMYYITKKSEDLGYTIAGTSEKVREILTNFNIEYNLPPADMNIIKKAILLDKKNISGNINLVLLKQIGHAFIHSIPTENINKFF